MLKSALKSEHLKEFCLIGNLMQPDYYLAGERKIRKLPELIFMYRINNSISLKSYLDGNKRLNEVMIRQITGGPYARLSRLA